MSKAYDAAHEFLQSPEVSELVDNNTEVRVTSETGGQKGKKGIEMGRLPSTILDVAEHFTKGSEKYPDPEPGRANWTLGYEWSLSFNALCRHLFAWWFGEDLDPELRSSHLNAVAFHALVLAEFQKLGIGTDDRVVHVK